VLLASPIPPPYRSVFTLVRPLTFPVWLSALFALFLLPIAFNKLYKKEKKVVEIDAHIFCSYLESLWFCLATLVGENVFLSSQLSMAWSLR